MNELTVPVQRMTLHTLTEEFLTILHLLEEACEGGEVPEEAQQHLEGQLAQVEQQLPVKIDGYMTVIREIEHFSAKCQDEADRLQNRADRWKAKSQYLRDRVLQAMQALKLPRIKTPLNTVAVVKNGGKQPLLIPEHIEFIPLEYCISRTVIEPDKAKIREALETGSPALREEVGQFASLQERGTHLRIS